MKRMSGVGNRKVRTSPLRVIKLDFHNLLKGGIFVEVVYIVYISAYL